MQIMKKIYYNTDKTITDILRDIYEEDANAHEEAYTSMLLYILEKGGLLEDGMPVKQFEVLFDAFIEANDSLGALILEGVAGSETD